MSMFFGLVGFVGVAAFVIMAVIAGATKKGNAKKYLMYAGISFVIFVVGLSIPSEPEPVVPSATETAAESPKKEVEADTSEEDKKAAEAEAAAQKEAEEKAKAEAEAKAAEEQKAAEAEQAKIDAETEKALDAEGINKAEFEEIQNGMTYEEVVKIIGTEGELTSEVGEKGTAYHTVMYTYPGETGLGANAIIMFQGNKLNTKSQFGLE